MLEKAREVLEERKEVLSLREFHSLVRARLREEERKYRLSPQRLLKIVALSEIKVGVEKKHGRKRSEHCPLCATAIVSSKSTNLFGEKVEMGYSCPRCGYHTLRRSLVPGRYYFYL